MAFIDTSNVANLATSTSALATLSVLSFTESAFFVIPPEVLLLPMALSNPQSALWLGLFTSFTSLLGALFGYFIGHKGGKPLLKKLFSDEKIDKVKILYNKYDASAILVSAFTPIPFKIFTVSAGVFDIELKRFITAAVVGRTSRYMLISALIYFFGEQARGFIENKLDKIMIYGTLGLIFAFILYKYALPILEEKYLKESLKDKVKRLFSKTR